MGGRQKCGVPEAWGREEKKCQVKKKRRENVYNALDLVIWRSLITLLRAILVEGWASKPDSVG